MRLAITALLGCFMAALQAGCSSLPPLPNADLSQPGWVVRRGQAVWRARTGAAEIAGDLLVATHPSGDTLVQFTKEPFPMVVARSTRDDWQIESPMQNRRYTSRGHAPSRIIWLQLPLLLANEPAPAGWLWQRFDQKQWRLTNQRTGEQLEGYFSE